MTIESLWVFGVAGDALEAFARCDVETRSMAVRDGLRAYMYMNDERRGVSRSIRARGRL